MEKTRLSKIIAFLVEMIISINLSTQLKGLNNSLSTVGFLRKKAVVIGLLLGLLLSGLVIGWGLLVLLMVLSLHTMSVGWLDALLYVFMINLVFIGLIIAIFFSMEK